MSIWWNVLGLLTAAVSAAALYAASPHCRWRLPRFGSAVAGMLLAAASLVSWTRVLGVAVGVCAMLAAWMLAMVALPWLALVTRGKIVGTTRRP